MTIRPTTEKDIDGVASLEKRAFSTPRSYEDFVLCCEKDSYVYFVAADEEDRVVGYAGFQYVIDEADIENIAVDEGARRQGIARALMNTLLSDGQKRGVKTFFLEVRESNEPAVRLYESLGFVRIGTRKDYYRDPIEDARVYTLKTEEPVC